MMETIFPGKGVYLDSLNFIAEFFLVLFFFHGLESSPDKVRRRAGYAALTALSLLYFFSGDITSSVQADTYRFADQMLRLALYFLPVYGFLRLAKNTQRVQACYLGLYYVFFYEMTYIYRHIVSYLALNRWNGREDRVLLANLGVGAVLVVEYFFAWMVRRSVPLHRIVSIQFFRLFFVLAMNLVSIFLKYSMITQKAGGAESPLWSQILYPLLTGLSMEFIMVFFESYQAVEADRKALQLQKEMRSYELAMASKAAEADQTVRQFHHDMKNHLLAIRSMEQGTGSAVAYIDSIMGQLEVCDELIATGLPYLDAYLTQKLSALRQAGVSCHIALSLAPLTQITPIDMISIIGNGVDNAGEALQRLPEDRRLLMVKSCSFANTILLQFINPFDGTLKWSGGRLSTLKPDPASHGIGLKTIHRIAEKYGGTATIDADGERGQFQLTVMLPFPGEGNC